ncbi:MAG: hypothetical protein VW687_12990 [Curvibacter sp.]
MQDRQLIHLFLLQPRFSARTFRQPFFQQLLQGLEPNLLLHTLQARCLGLALQVAHRPALQADGMAQALHEMLVVLHQFGADRGRGGRGPARVGVRGIALQLVELPAGMRERAARLLPGLVGLVARARRPRWPAPDSSAPT